MQFFITERGELNSQLDHAQNEIQQRYTKGDALLAISKNANSTNLHNFLLRHKDYTIFHATITGYGGTKIERGAPTPETAINGIKQLIEKGFPAKQIVLRIDPIIPTEKGINKAISLINSIPQGIKRIRISFIDNYPHINGLPFESFHAPLQQRTKAIKKLQETLPSASHENIQSNKCISLEACGEPGIQSYGCISERDFEILGLNQPNSSRKGQRKDCSCFSQKTEILIKPQRCSNGCLYCYYKLGN